MIMKKRGLGRRKVIGWGWYDSEDPEEDMDR